MSAKHLARKVEVRREKVLALHREITELTYAAILACNHQSLAECAYSSHGFPPLRVCLTCGMSEEGWGCGYQELIGDDVRTVTREDIYARRRVVASPNHVFVNGDREAVIRNLLVCLP